jgi:hypothetical protein
MFEKEGDLTELSYFGALPVLVLSGSEYTNSNYSICVEG